ncbi:uncharacterized protein MONOS_10268 [Monocercomonoides exilis]|uniref:uncharacterized protein n=1 Tax=Monocercomonoides exilis TaxID=2049356 RepID=UPI00355AC8C6|nr:hypothetical protein MONOS_10268 [Monocercomonoides exilis]|eukprot:MONOS_10268.1-p1 / transcript=MONOS_10268.1 / gene=MONOS_10268 / organism=Monocercomonoides_exilis_PA203 / gene_product=unspecified product / transcript_product=unspecified product / location=Mono_scaffold00459:33874-34307(-) / protein_length=123 / sequence_SO=supercontig / SO=protein_coding / is_pseudo=false
MRIKEKKEKEGLEEKEEYDMDNVNTNEEFGKASLLTSSATPSSAETAPLIAHPLEKDQRRKLFLSCSFTASVPTALLAAAQCGTTSTALLSSLSPTEQSTHVASAQTIPTSPSILCLTPTPN